MAKFPTLNRINLNTVSEGEILNAFPYVGEARTKSIIEYRENNGGFNSIDELKNVHGIADGIFERLLDDSRFEITL